MRFAAKLLAVLLCISVAACVKVADPGAANWRSTGESNADGGPGDDPSAADPGETCERGQAGYDSFFEQMVAGLGANLCMADGNCRITIIDNRCSHGCGIAVNARVAATLKANLDDYAATHCAACPKSDTPCPTVEYVAFCTGGVCSAH
jgi:hypothetical protein